VAEITEQDNRQLDKVVPDVKEVLRLAKDNPDGPGIFHPAHKDYPEAVAIAAAWANRVKPERPKDDGRHLSGARA